MVKVIDYLGCVKMFLYDKEQHVDRVNGISEAKAAASQIVNAQEATYTEHCTLPQIQAKETDLQALSELTRALYKKEALLLELRHMNDEVEGNHKDGENFLKGLEPFKKQYAMVLVQLQAANDQVSSALLYLRQRNTYPTNPQFPLMKSVANLVSLGGPLGSFDHSGFLCQESGSHVAAIVDSSRLKAKTMVDTAVQTCTERQYPPAEVAQILDSAVTSLKPCSQNLHVYGEIQRCMGIV
ncbi:hypothetical protein NE237_011566 [Protea cynaroides]|uniref:Uncharacterized protein n=1 Tax=Protea cynaroides TaxID=273540 RepID=A0A9Q0JYD4_9MAGN|nr:hypothetical protein NE237_011566 [Protea cynaroides]